MKIYITLAMFIALCLSSLALWYHFFGIENMPQKFPFGTMRVLQTITEFRC